MSNPCPRCGVPGPVVVSSDGALPPDLMMADEVTRLRAALERIANGDWPISGYDDMTGANHMRDIARAALGRTP